MNTLQRASAIKRLQEMAERLPDGSFDRVAINAAVGDIYESKLFDADSVCLL